MQQVHGGDSGHGSERGSTAIEYAMLVSALAGGTIVLAAVLGQVIDIYLAIAAAEMGGTVVSGP